MINDIRHTYQLDECACWIVENGYKKVAIQLGLEGLKNSASIIEYLKENIKQKLSQIYSTDQLAEPDLYITRSNTCCVDLLVTQHVDNLDAVIHMGKVCLSMPDIKNRRAEQPILFAFGHQPLTDSEFEDRLKIVLAQIKYLKEIEANCRLCLMYDTSLIDYANRLEQSISEEGYSRDVHVAKLHFPNPLWETTKGNRVRFSRTACEEDSRFGFYRFPKPIEHYNCAIYLGDRPSISLTLSGPPKLFRINCYSNMDVESINVSKLLNKRIALVSRLKDDDELKIGVIITNPLPDVKVVMQRLEALSKPRKHTLYFISMIQTIDECKIGNFDLCDAFIVINSCTCSTTMESLVFNRPILSEIEFKLACGFEAEYGRVIWPGSSSHLSAEDMINKRRVSDVSLALIHTRNELLERCSQARANKWSGMEYTAPDRIEGETQESLNIEAGLEGIASSYLSEPLKRFGPSASGSGLSGDGAAGEKDAGTNASFRRC